MTVIETSNWEALADRALADERPSRDEALAVLHAPDEEVLSLLAAVFRVRRAHFGLLVKLNMIVNAKSGICPEDCGYCSQSIVSTAEIPKYSLLDADMLVAGAHEAWSRKARTYCIVASGRGPSARELREVTTAVRRIKQELPMKICACLGLLTPRRRVTSSRPGSSATTTTSTPLRATTRGSRRPTPTTIA